MGSVRIPDSGALVAGRTRVQCDDARSVGAADVVLGLGCRLCFGCGWHVVWSEVIVGGLEAS